MKLKTAEREVLPIVIMFVGAENMFNLVGLQITAKSSIPSDSLRWTPFARHL
jgi:hypothetical protein